MGWTRCFGCKKLQHDFVAQTFALIAQVQYVLQQVSCSYDTIPNALKYYKTDQNISLGSNGADWVCSLRKHPYVTSCHEVVLESFATNASDPPHWTINSYFGVFRTLCMQLGPFRYCMKLGANGLKWCN